MFDSRNRVEAQGLDVVLPQDVGVWSVEDDARVAALTESALADFDRAPVDSGWLVSDVPVELLAAALAGPWVPVGVVEGLRARARVVAFHQARLLESMMAVVDEYTSFDSVLALEGAAAEVRAALVLTRRAAESDLDLAWCLRDRLPQVLEALRQGRIDLRRAWVVVSGTSHLEEEVARRVVSQVLERAEGRTTGQLNALLQRLCVDLDPDDAVRRFRSASEERKVVAELGVDSTATMVASDLAPERVAAVMDRLTRLAHSLRRSGEERSIDQLRADIFLDLLEGNTSSAPMRGTVDIRVDLATLVGLEDRAAELAGWGPVVADIARQLTLRHGPSWRVTVTDPEGGVVHSGVTRRRPDAPLRRLVESRDPICVFPGCRRPSTACDLDHRVRVADGGETHPDQLVPLCRHDHVIRHRHGWTHTPNPDGTHTWTSPLGANYTRPPPL
jgi:Domain of unknown function (DUF222)